MRRMRMRKLALLLSLLALTALGLVACGGGDDEDSATEAKVFAHTPPEGKLSREQAQELKGETLPPEKVQELKREANTWAALFAGVATSQLVRERAARPNACNRYVGQPICERLACERKYWIENFENCTPVSAAYQKSFAGATVEDITLKGVAGADGDTPIYLAPVKFSNGEVVAFNGTGDESYSCAGAGSGCTWNIASEDQNRRFLQAAAPRE
jgi:hypothetical protein